MEFSFYCSWSGFYKQQNAHQKNARKTHNSYFPFFEEPITIKKNRGKSIKMRNVFLVYQSTGTQCKVTKWPSWQIMLLIGGMKM